MLYALGYRTEYDSAVPEGRAVKYAALWAAGRFRGIAEDMAAIGISGRSTDGPRPVGPVVLFFQGSCPFWSMPTACAKKKGFAVRLPRKRTLSYKRPYRRNLSLLPRMAMYALPICALALGAAGCSNMSSTSLNALDVQVNHKGGLCGQRRRVQLCPEAVQERINYAGADHAFTVEPTYTVTVAHDVMDENEMADAILKSSSDQISEGTALYLDGELTAVCGRHGMQRYLSSLLEPYENPEDPNTTVGFNKDVTLENGIYFNESFQEEAEVEQ